MSANGKPNEGDVYITADGNMVCYMQNANGCWYKLYLTKNGTMFITDPSPDASYFNYKYVMNMKSLLIQVRKELEDESSS